MKKSKARKILQFYNDIESAEPEISTERLLSMTADRASRYFKQEIDVGHIVEALEKTGSFEHGASHSLSNI